MVSVLGEPETQRWIEPPAPIPRIEIFDELDSTNAEARRRAEAGDAGPVWIVARRQSAGRGRRGRAWSTEVGNLAATLLTQFDGPPADAARLSFLTALAIVDVFDAFASPALVTIKWPNDVLLEGRKASGVLIESGALAQGRLWMAIGCGLNLRHAPTQTERPSTRLTDHLRADVVAPPTLEEAAALLAKAFGKWRTTLERSGFAAISLAWTARAAGLGESCVARVGDAEIEGTAEGLEPDGALRLRLGDGTARRITAADIFFAPA